MAQPKPPPDSVLRVQQLAMSNASTILLGAASARLAAELAARHGPAELDAEIAKNVEHFSHLLRPAVSFTRENTCRDVGKPVLQRCSWNRRPGGSLGSS